MLSDVFLSHSSKDSDIAKKICTALESANIKCWIAPRDIMPGAEWAESIINGIERASIFLLIVSSHSNESPQVLREVERVINKKIPIIPFRIEDITLSKSLEYFICNHQWVDAISTPIEKHLDNLVSTMNRVLIEVSDKPPAEVLKADLPIQEKIVAKRTLPVILAGIAIFVLLSIGLFFYFNHQKDTKIETLRSELSAIVSSAPKKIIVTAQKKSFKIGEQMKITCKVAESGYLNILSLSPGDNEAVLLYPNKYHQDNRVEKETVITIPALGDGFALTAQPPTGESLIVAIHTKQEINVYRGDNYKNMPALFQTITKRKLKGWAVTPEGSNRIWSAGKFSVKISD